ncbi:helix-turn-helix transcriptional regulator [Eubacteriales bacterium OttesenSCG-928-M02]|nr:helix-turn-helix transcriptional regulator [Eubacteriales bacterium OttesenSCG-928-M02]
MDFQTLLIEEREKQGLSLKKLSEKSGIPVTTIANYEKGVEPTLGKADAILRALGLSKCIGMQTVG